MTINKHLKTSAYFLLLGGVLILTHIQAKNDLLKSYEDKLAKSTMGSNENITETTKIALPNSDNPSGKNLAEIKKSEAGILKLSEDLKQMEFSLQNVTHQLAEQGMTTDDNQPPLSEKEQARQLEEHHRQTYEIFANTLEAEKKDAQWSASVENQLAQSLDAVKDKLNTDEIDCRTTICRLEIGKLEGAQDDEVMEAIEMKMNWPGEVNLTYDPNTGRATVYLSREGHALPALSEEDGSL